MRIIISPAKQMTTEGEAALATAAPAMLAQAQEILSYLQGLSLPEAQKLWGCSDALAQKSFEQLRGMTLDEAALRDATPAILAYDGIAFKYMAPSVFENGEFDYVQEHLRILSGLFGAVRPLDGVLPYRLEMQAKALVSNTKNLYDFWGKRIYDNVMDDSRVVVNLASKEYSKCIEKYLQPEDTMVTCVFGELSGSKVVQKGVYAKMARGDMVRFMAEQNILEPAGMREYSRLGYSFDTSRSTDETYVFLK